MRRLMLPMLCVALLAGATAPALGADAPGAGNAPTFFTASRSDQGVVLTAAASSGLSLPGEPVLLSVRLRNDSPSDISVYRPNPCSGVFFAMLTSPSGSSELLPEVGSEGSVCAEVIGPPLLLHPGQATHAQFVWRTSATAAPGDYQLTARYMQPGADAVAVHLFVRLGDFSDLGGHWAAEAVRNAAREGSVAGYPDGSFRPDQPISRAEFFQLLTNALRLPPQPAGGAIAVGHWAAPVLATAVDRGLLYPPDYADGPNWGVAMPRQEIVLASVRALGEQALVDEQHPTLSAADAATYPTWLQGWAAVALRAGIVAGYPDGSLGLDRTASRAEALTVITRIARRLRVAVAPLAAAPPAGAVRYPAAGEPYWTVQQTADLHPTISDGVHAYTFATQAWGVRLLAASGDAAWVAYLMNDGRGTAGVVSHLHAGKLTEVSHLAGRQPELLATDGAGRLWFADPQGGLLQARPDGTVVRLTDITDRITGGGLDASNHFWALGDHGWPAVNTLYRVQTDGTVTAFPVQTYSQWAAQWLGVTGDGVVWVAVDGPPAAPHPAGGPYFVVSAYSAGQRSAQLAEQSTFQMGPDPVGMQVLGRSGGVLWLARLNQRDDNSAVPTALYGFDLVTGALRPLLAPATVAAPYAALASPEGGVLLQDADDKLWQLQP